ncbi:MAG TPA: winged helix-turn-helix domain-containing protein [Paludibaculum sp.]|jgi:Tol biopolymer transport system component/DNA-binding winged helix-turn-helix (wHTH) protein
MPQSQLTGIIRFGAFEVEPQAGVLRKHGVRIRLQEQPFQVLLVLLEKRGEPVSREELQRRVWAGTAFGDFDHSLNIAINRIREALGDSAETPRFVETLPRRGYRFVGPVEGGVAPAEATPNAAPVKVRGPKWIPIGGAALGLVALAGGAAWLLLPPAPPALQWHRLTNDNLRPKSAPVLSDGARLYFAAGWLTSRKIFQVPLSGGEPTSLPGVLPPARSPYLLDITPDGQELLIGAVPGSYLPGELWTLRIADGSTRRVAELHAWEARYSPDGGRIAFTLGGIRTPGSLWVASSDGSNARSLLEVKGLDIHFPCWSTDGRRIAFEQRNRASQERNAWEIREDGTGIRRLLPEWRQNHSPGGWTPDGRLILSSEGQLWTAQQRLFYQRSQPPPLQLSTGEPLFPLPLQLRNSRTFYAVGRTPLAQLERFDARQGIWVPHLGGVSAEAVYYSKDGQRLTYVTFPEGELWTRRADGSEPVQLTKAPMRAAEGKWSPDGKLIAFMGKSTSDQPWRIYLLDATGGTARPACPSGCGPQGDFTWAPDGKKILFAAPVGSFFTEEQYLRLVDLGTGEVTRFPGSDRFHSPRWSPDGSAISASAFPGGGHIMLYNFAERKWRALPHPGPGGPSWPSWSRDGQSIWYYNVSRGEIVRCHVRENRHEVTLQIKFEELTGLFGYFFGLTPNDEPLILRRRDIDQIYALDWKAR